MRRWYLDTSAAMKLLVAEAETEPLSTWITGAQRQLVACYLLESEVRRAVQRYPDLGQVDAVALLDGVDLYEVPPSLFREAGLLPGEHLRALDAIHVAAAVRLGVDGLVTYDHRMAAGVRAVGLPVVSPSSLG